MAREVIRQAEYRDAALIEQGGQQIEHEVGAIARGKHRWRETRRREIEARNAEQILAFRESRYERRENSLPRSIQAREQPLKRSPR